MKGLITSRTQVLDISQAADFNPMPMESLQHPHVNYSCAGHLNDSCAGHLNGYRRQTTISVF